jgi:membrane fusion protein (multidrug efflux system)
VRKNLTTSESYGNDWIVTSGLDSGDRVIVAGLQGVREGGQAKAVPWQSPQLTARPPEAGVADGSGGGSPVAARGTP